MADQRYIAAANRMLLDQIKNARIAADMCHEQEDHERGEACERQWRYLIEYALERLMTEES